MMTTDPDSKRSPQITVTWLGYNQENFVAESLNAAFAQRGVGFELQIADDASTDRTPAIIEALLPQCPPHIDAVAYLNEKNQGLIRQCNQLFQMARGEVIVLMAGDDRSSPERVAKMAEIFKKYPECQLVFTAWNLLDEHGQLKGSGGSGEMERSYSLDDPKVDDIFAGVKAPGACFAFRRHLIEDFGPLEARPQVEDRPLLFRALLSGSVRYFPEKLVDYRIHAGSLSVTKSVQDTPENRKMIIRKLILEQNYPRQYRKDLAQATWLSMERRKWLDRLITQRHERIRLYRYSMTKAPMKLWLGSAMRLLRARPTVSNLIRVFNKELLVRFLATKNRRVWRKRLHTRN